jgi:hypothetical protein
MADEKIKNDVFLCLLLHDIVVCWPPLLANLCSVLYNYFYYAEIVS